MLKKGAEAADAEQDVSLVAELLNKKLPEGKGKKGKKGSTKPGPSAEPPVKRRASPAREEAPAPKKLKAVAEPSPTKAPLAEAFELQTTSLEGVPDDAFICAPYHVPLDRHVLKTDSVARDQEIGLSLLTALCHPEDMSQLPDGAVARFHRTSALLVQTALSLVGAMHLAGQEETYLENKLRKKESRVTALEVSMAKADTEIAKLKAESAKLRERGKAAEEKEKAVLKEMEALRGSVDSQLQEARRLATAAAREVFRPQVQEGIDAGTDRGMARGFPYGYRLALKKANVPKDSDLYVVPEVPSYDDAESLGEETVLEAATGGGGAEEGEKEVTSGPQAEGDGADSKASAEA